MPEETIEKEQQEEPEAQAEETPEPNAEQEQEGEESAEDAPVRPLLTCPKCGTVGSESALACDKCGIAFDLPAEVTVTVPGEHCIRFSGELAKPAMTGEGTGDELTVKVKVAGIGLASLFYDLRPHAGRHVETIILVQRPDEEPDVHPDQTQIPLEGAEEGAAGEPEAEASPDDDDRDLRCSACGCMVSSEYMRPGAICQSCHDGTLEPIAKAEEAAPTEGVQEAA